jgi:hypothetical protein
MKIPKKIIDGSYENFKKFIMEAGVFEKKEKPSTSASSIFPQLNLPEEKESIFLKECIPSTNTPKDSFSSPIQHGEHQEKNKIINEKHHPIESFFSSLPSQPSKSKKNMVDEQDHILRSPHHHLSNHILIENGVEIIK